MGKHMRAIVVSAPGDADALQLKEVPRPDVQPDHVLIHVAAIGVNFIDVYLREGRYPAPLPFINGQEGAGVVVDVGSGVTSFSVGDRVAWAGQRGAYAEFASVPASAVLKLPDEVSFEDAAAVLLQGMTAHFLSHDTYVIKPGDTVLIHAGAGGVGLLLTQMAKMRGARVMSTVSTEAKAELSRAAGADHVILYTTQSFVEEVKKATGGEGLPVVYDSVGKTTFDESLKCLRPRGLMVLFGGSSGAVPPLDLMKLSQMGSLYVTRPTMHDYTRTRVELEARAKDLFEWIARGKLHVRVGHRYTLADAAQAHRDLEARRSTGKLLLIP
jgi:NADPH2:quinone reductase